MKKKVISFAFLFLVSAGLWAAPPKIAVLDATIPKGVDVSVQIPITESIIEQMVRSNKYTVLDRGNIAAIFKERDFQLSGEVTDADITKAGQFLGAAFVVVTKVQVIGGTYFLSSKVIDAQTAVITAQSSDRYKGDIAELISLAQNVGYKLANGVNEVPFGAIAVATTTTSTTVPQPLFREPPTDYTDYSSKELPGLRVVVAATVPTFFGAFYEDSIKAIADKAYDTKQNLIGGYEVFAVINVDENLYMMLEFDSFNLDLNNIKGLSGNIANKETATSFQIQNLLIGFGVSKNIGVLRPYAGAFIGNSNLKIGEFWSNPGLAGTAKFTAGTKSDQIIVGGEVGVALYLFNFVVLDARARVGSFGPEMSSEITKSPMNFFNISLGAGVAF